MEGGVRWGRLAGDRGTEQESRQNDSRMEHNEMIIPQDENAKKKRRSNRSWDETRSLERRGKSDRRQAALPDDSCQGE